MRRRLNSALALLIAVACACGFAAGRSVAQSPAPDWFDYGGSPRLFPIDLSFLNAGDKPAGRRGYIRADGDRLVYPDGAEARFWGVNLTAYALFNTGLDDTRQQARRLAAMGVNLVRIHHHDSEWVSPNVFGQQAGTRTLDPESMRRLDWWIACLKEEGIYVWLDLDVGRTFSAQDEITDFEEIAKGKPRVRGAYYATVNASIRGRMKEFASAYLGHVNQYTKLAYKDDPAIAFVLITNENDVTHHFGNWLLPGKDLPNHSRRYMDEASAFASRHGLDRERTWRSWEHGPSKLFLNDLEHRFNAEMISHLKAIGVKSLIATTNFWGDEPMSSLLALTDGDFIDVHTYGRPGFLSRGPDEAPGPVHVVAGGSVAGKPLTVSEWNIEPWPSPDRGALPIWMSAVGVLQHWDALVEFAYTQAPPDDGIPPNQWAFFNDPALLVTMPVAALIYRRASAPRDDVLTFFPERAFDVPVSAATARILRTAPERRRMNVALPSAPSLPWFRPLAPPNDAVRHAGADLRTTTDSVCSEPKLLCRNWTEGVLTVETPQDVVAAGRLAGRTLILGPVEIQVTSPVRSVVAVQTLDGRPIAGSDNLLLSVAAHAISDEASRSRTLSEPVVGTVKLNATAGLTLYRLEAIGRRQKLAVTYDNGAYVVPLTGTLRTHWLALSR